MTQRHVERLDTHVNPSLDEMPVTVLLVPGMWHGAWAWAQVEKELSERGIRHVSITFPGRGRLLGDDTLRGHASYLSDRLDEIEGRVVVVAHSYGGAVVTEAVESSRVAAIIFLAAFPLEPGESVASVADERRDIDEVVGPDNIDLTDGYLEVDHDTAISGFYHDCEPADAEAAFARLTPENPSVRTTAVTRASWKSVRSLYIVCTDDHALSPGIQRRLAARVDTSLEMDSGHSAMMSHARELSAIIERVVAQVQFD